jgi:hypothetical protein
MKIKTALAMLAVTFAPSLAMAEGCIHSKTQQSASQCAVGQVWNAETQTCSSVNS